MRTPKFKICKNDRFGKLVATSERKLKKIKKN
jgi:hypothetical protein